MLCACLSTVFASELSESEVRKNLGDIIKALDDYKISISSQKNDYRNKVDNIKKRLLEIPISSCKMKPTSLNQVGFGINCYLENKKITRIGLKTKNDKDEIVLVEYEMYENGALKKYSMISDNDISIRGFYLDGSKSLEVTKALNEKIKELIYDKNGRLISASIVDRVNYNTKEEVSLNNQLYAGLRPLIEKHISCQDKTFDRGAFDKELGELCLQKGISDLLCGYSFAAKYTREAEDIMEIPIGDIGAFGMNALLRLCDKERISWACGELSAGIRKWDGTVVQDKDASKVVIDHVGQSCNLEPGLDILNLFSTNDNSGDLIEMAQELAQLPLEDACRFAGEDSEYCYQLMLYEKEESRSLPMAIGQCNNNNRLSCLALKDGRFGQQGEAAYNNISDEAKKLTEAWQFNERESIRMEDVANFQDDNHFVGDFFDYFNSSGGVIDYCGEAIELAKIDTIQADFGQDDIGGMFDGLTPEDYGVGDLDFAGPED
ncbi:MAG: hypothetical protein A2504_16800 [Bdellovibrionales bacterium RIFOXYD12_FULL_39_22]|nr:MAG: hypothetical protein A2385_14655 [Bdellovibrionales bacterium RIFOXYB1_FULL_39_21]OFZ45030.1 MAG: hypothetical protein A2485_14080 [Bdellovibrionales bacterium RIFOXYC12_FULL_39_17]OFZ72864.1 MAG: hypothetical protein A2451_15605 [Bdellovibrionales bacterium RIFOXYC2_FULL_39_8]OFZ95652.1 MAG: hypothetical protein A2504_16800 [Bdellovibrionales bacterium RIFOXYD12_FULL_39_22]